MRLNFVLGTAAELIKMFPVIQLAKTRGHAVQISATGQSHDNFLLQYRDFRLNENELDWLWPSLGDLDNSGSALRWFLRANLGRSKVAHESDYVLVHGDTLSTLTAARYGRSLGKTVVHVEAGLRSPSLLNPFPEEITRRWVSKLARVHFAPDEVAVRKLGGVQGTVVNTQGNTLLDAVRMTSNANEQVPQEPYALVNVHRFENLNSERRWRMIVDTLLKASQRLKLVVVAHPQTRAKLEGDREALQRLRAAGIDLRDRLKFSSFITLLKGARFLISDGGSNQEECSYLGQPCLLLREATERREGLDGSCLLSRFEPTLIDGFLADPEKYRRAPLKTPTTPSQIIVETLETL